MTKKQIKKHAAQILAWEKIRQDPDASKKQKYEAEQNINQLTNMIMELPHGQGLTILMEIDDIIQRQVASNNESIKQGDN